MTLDPREDHITGVMVQYYISCQRELWFFAHKINMNTEDQNILIGRRLHEESYRREKKNVNLGPVSFDFTKGEDNLVVHEIKKSRKLTKPAVYQLYYYLWFLKQRGVDAEGVLVYPTERRRRKITLTDQKEKEIERILEEIEKIIAKPNPPPATKKPYCKGCSYYDFCKV